MLVINLPKTEYWDEKKEEFVYSDGGVLKLEHSLISISKWESKWHKPFLGDSEKTPDEILDYIKCMTINGDTRDGIYDNLTSVEYNKINDYIKNPMTASTVTRRGPKGSTREIVTSELIYYWMINYGVPVEFEKWHINRLLMLIQICEAKQSKPQRQSARDIYSQQKALNAARKKQRNSRG